MAVSPRCWAADMRTLRLIPRLDIKGPNLIKGIHLEGLRVIGNPQKFAQSYYEAGADELVYMDIVASLYGRNNLADIIHRATQSIFIPITVGGGIRSVEDARTLLLAGADKVALNTAAVLRPELLSELARTFGAQCIVLSIEAKRTPTGGWQAYTDNGREPSGLDVVAWARQAEALGVGEILLTSVDQEGTRKGFDLAVVKAVTDAVSIPVIASGGMGTIDHLRQLTETCQPDAVAIAEVLHRQRLTLPQIRTAALDMGLPVRRVETAGERS